MKRSLKVAIIALAIVAGGAAVANAAFNTNLTVGSTGADVSALQSWLISKGFAIPSISSGAAQPGYFGSQTQAAVKLYQASVGLPNTGFVGPLTRGILNGTSVPSTPVATGCPVGYTCTANPGTPSPSTGMPSEGSFTVNQAAQPANNTNVTSNVNVPVYGVKVKAQNSDMVIDRADLEFAVTVNSTTVNPAGFVTSITAWDGTTALKTMNLSANDFTKDSSNLYYVRLTGIGFKVAKDTEKTLTFSINTTSVSSADYTRTVTVKGYSGSTQNIRGTDTLGLQSYGNNSWTGTFTFAASNNATLTASANSASTPKAQTIAVNTTDGVRGVVMQTLDLKSTIGDSNLTDVRVYVKTDSVTTSAPTALYLYDGSTLLSSASVTVTSGSGTVNFQNLDVAIAKDTTKTLTVKADFPSTAVGVASTTILTSGAETNTTMFETADGSSKEVTISSAITGNDVHLYADSAPIWTLVSANAVGSAGVVSVASSSITGTIVLNVKANGGTLTKPVASDFTVFFASSTALTTNGGTGYTATAPATGISVTPVISSITPTDSTVGDGSSYTVTLTATLYSNNASFGSSQSVFMAVNNIDSAITKTGGTNTITNQNWGIDNFYTNTVQLTKGTL